MDTRKHRVRPLYKELAEQSKHGARALAPREPIRIGYPQSYNRGMRGFASVR